MRVFGILGTLLAAAIVLILLVVVGRSVANAGGENSAGAQTGSQKAYQEMKGDGDLDDPQETMRDALRNP